jgi:hypothetical protein
MTERRRGVRARGALALGLALCLALATGASPAGDPDWRLVRASADGAGGGGASGPTFEAVLAYGQPDANPPAYGGRYGFAGGVFAALPADRVFADGFE